MELILNRNFDDGKVTVGDLFVDGVLTCVTLEDTFRHVKVAGGTRIPAGRYEIKLRTSSPMATRYKAKYGTNGMLWLQNVENYKYVYIHIGNTEQDTEGCILVGQELRRRVSGGVSSSVIVSSTRAYGPLHSEVSVALNSGDAVFITILPL